MSRYFSTDDCARKKMFPQEENNESNRRLTHTVRRGHVTNDHVDQWPFSGTVRTAQSKRANQEQYKLELDRQIHEKNRLAEQEMKSMSCKKATLRNCKQDDVKNPSKTWPLVSDKNTSKIPKRCTQGTSVSRPSSKTNLENSSIPSPATERKEEVGIKITEKASSSPKVTVDATTSTKPKMVDAAIDVARSLCCTPVTISGHSLVLSSRHLGVSANYDKDSFDDGDHEAIDAWKNIPPLATEVSENSAKSKSTVENTIDYFANELEMDPNQKAFLEVPVPTAPEAYCDNASSSLPSPNCQDTSGTSIDIAIHELEAANCANACGDAGMDTKEDSDIFSTPPEECVKPTLPCRNRLSHPESDDDFNISILGPSCAQTIKSLIVSPKYAYFWVSHQDTSIIEDFKETDETTLHQAWEVEEAKHKRPDSAKNIDEIPLKPPASSYYLQDDIFDESGEPGPSDNNGNQSLDVDSTNSQMDDSIVSDSIFFDAVNTSVNSEEVANDNDNDTYPYDDSFVEDISEHDDGGTQNKDISNESREEEFCSFDADDNFDENCFKKRSQCVLIDHVTVSKIKPETREVGVQVLFEEICNKCKCQDHTNEK